MQGGNDEGFKTAGRCCCSLRGALALAVAAVALGSPARIGAAKAEGGSLTVWLSGTYAGATPGSTYRKWLDGIKARYEKAYPGSTVKFVLTPINNAQFTAQIAAAFASKKVPDVMLVYSGGYTTPYMLSSLEKLNDQVDEDPGLLRGPDRVGSVVSQPRLQGRQGRHLRRPERPRDVRAVLQQGAVPQGRDRGAAEDVQGAPRAVRQVQGQRGSSRSRTATVTATRPTTG